jgi:hypothetical protein
VRNDELNVAAVYVCVLLALLILLVAWFSGTPE